MKYEEWIDVAKGIGILLVIIGHSPFDQSIKTIISTFHMPLFFFISGYLFDWSKYNKNATLFILNKSKRLVHPYFLTNILLLCIFSLMSCLKTHKFESNILIIKSLIGIIYGNGAPLNPPTIFTNMINVPSWFLVCLFCGSILLYIIASSHEKYSLSLSCFLCLFFTIIGFEISKYIYLPWGFDIACVSMIFMFPGYLLSYYTTHSFYVSSGKSYINLFLILILFFVIEINGSVDMNTRNYSNLLFFAIGGLLGTLMMIDFSKKITKKKVFLSKFLVYLGQNSLIILLYHSFTPKLFLDIINMFIDVNVVYNSGILYTLNALTFSILTVIFIKKIPYLKNIY